MGAGAGVVALAGKRTNLSVQVRCFGPMRQNLGSTTTIYGIGYSNFGKRSLKFAASDQLPGEQFH
jgi:hypothetical protein